MIVKQSADKPRGTRRKPHFVIEHDGRLFVTRALVEIDPKTAGGRNAGGHLEEIRNRLRSEQSAARAARYQPGSGGSAVERLLSGTVETRGTMAEFDDGTSFAATNPPKD